VAAAHRVRTGAYLIAAGPGTGKTFTATERFLLADRAGSAPDQILTVTFSDRAAEELRRRITDELSARRPDPWNPGARWRNGSVRFTVVCARLLDEFATSWARRARLRCSTRPGSAFSNRSVARLRSGATAPFDPDSFAALVASMTWTTCCDRGCVSC